MRHPATLSRTAPPDEIPACPIKLPLWHSRQLEACLWTSKAETCRPVRAFASCSMPLYLRLSAHMDTPPHLVKAQQQDVISLSLFQHLRQGCSRALLQVVLHTFASIAPQDLLRAPAYDHTVKVSHCCDSGGIKRCCRRTPCWGQQPRD